MTGRIVNGGHRGLDAIGAVLVAASAALLVVAAHSSPAAAAGTVGATTPFTSQEAEAGTLGGGAATRSLTGAPTTQYSSPELEASGHAFVQLTASGQSVQWTNNTGHPISAINVRASIPDAASGGGTTATLDLYVDGTFRQPLNLNSKQTWLYEGAVYNGNDQHPASGSPRVFFDEAHTVVNGAPIAVGSTFSLRKDAANSAAFYYVDVVDVENPPAPLPQPANSISITDCGAVPGGGLTWTTTRWPKQSTDSLRRYASSPTGHGCTSPVAVHAGSSPPPRRAGQRTTPFTLAAELNGGCCPHASHAKPTRSHRQHGWSRQQASAGARSTTASPATSCI